MLINLIIQHIKRIDISAFIQNCILDMYIRRHLNSVVIRKVRSSEDK